LEACVYEAKLVNKNEVKPIFYESIPMSHCHALKKNQTGCRAYATVLTCSDDIITYSHTCKLHEDYFQNFKLTKSFIASLEFWPTLRTFLATALELGLICVKEDFIKSLPKQSRYAYFYLLCAKYTTVDLTWNVPLLHKTYNTLWKWMGAIGPVQIGYPDLFELAKKEPMGFYRMIYCYTHGLAPMKAWLKFFDRCAQEDWFEPMFHLDKQLHETHLTQTMKDLSNLPIPLESISLYKILDTQFIDWLQFAKQRRYEVIRNQCVFKEDLLEVAWEPRRLSWCMDEDVKQRWS
jgi:hypothetical protein